MENKQRLCCLKIWIFGHKTHRKYLRNQSKIYPQLTEACLWHIAGNGIKLGELKKKKGKEKVKQQFRKPAYTKQ